MWKQYGRVWGREQGGLTEKVLSSACSGQRVKTQKCQLSRGLKKCKGKQVELSPAMAQWSWNMEHRRPGDCQSQNSSGGPWPRAIHGIHRRVRSERAKAVSGRGRTKGESRTSVSLWQTRVKVVEVGTQWPRTILHTIQSTWQVRETNSKHTARLVRRLACNSAHRQACCFETNRWDTW